MNGKPVKDVGAEHYPVELGFTTLMPEFEKCNIDWNEGGRGKVIEISFPDDYSQQGYCKQNYAVSGSCEGNKEKRRGFRK